MKKYPQKLLTMIDNMLLLHFNYEEMYEQIQVSFSSLNISFDEMLDIVQDRLIKNIKV